jgi:hypothetical protein
MEGVPQMCICLSKWCKSSMTKSYTGKCNQCNKKIDVPHCAQTLVIGCKCTLNRIHSWIIRYHENCEFNIKEKDVKQFPILITQLSDKEKDVIRQEYFEIYPQTLTMCASCGVAVGKKTKKCKGCLSVYYCNLECQNKHWDQHKIFCKKNRVLSEMLKLRPCFTEMEVMYYKRSENMECCLEECGKKFQPSTLQTPTFLYRTCEKGGHHIHVIQKLFCNDKCREIDLKKFE